MSQVETDRSAAEAIARDIVSRPSRRGGWMEVRALMGRFGIDRLSESARDRMATALDEAGIRVDPPLSDLDRSDTAVLSCESGSSSPTVPLDPLESLLVIRVAAGGDTVRRVSLDDLRAGSLSGVRWFDVCNTARADASEMLEKLGPLCGGQLTREMVDDLLSPDPRPKIESYSGGAIRCVSAFQVTACESDEGAGDKSQSKAGVFVFEPVEFLVGSDWLITCWHDIEVYRGAGRIREDPPSPPADLFAEVERCWPARQLSSAGDLAVLVLLELALTYAPAYRELYAWEEEWELDFYRRPDEKIDRDTLLDARASAAILRDWLSPLNPAGMRENLERVWFPGVTGTKDSGGYERALHVDDRIDAALQGLREFNQSLRSAYDLLQLREGDRQRARDDQFQRTIAVGGSAILIPTLVAGIMGANTWVPGQFGEGSPHWAFIALVALVMLSGAVAWTVLHRVRERDDRLS